MLARCYFPSSTGADLSVHHQSCSGKVRSGPSYRRPQSSNLGNSTNNVHCPMTTGEPVSAWTLTLTFARNYVGSFDGRRQRKGTLR